MQLAAQRLAFSAQLDLNGIWTPRISDPGIGVPGWLADKYYGIVTWKIILAGDRLTVLEYVPDSWSVPNPDPQRLPYKQLKVKAVRVDPGGRWISFRIDRSYGGFEVFEEIELNDFDADGINGVYRAFDRWGGMRGTGPEYRGSIRLVRYGG